MWKFCFFLNAAVDLYQKSRAVNVLTKNPNFCTDCFCPLGSSIPMRPQMDFLAENRATHLEESLPVLLPNGNAQNATVRHTVWHILPSQQVLMKVLLMAPFLLESKVSMTARVTGQSRSFAWLTSSELNTWRIRSEAWSKTGIFHRKSLKLWWVPTWTTYQLSRHTEKFVYHPCIWRSNCAFSIPFPIVLGIVFSWYWLNQTLRTRAIPNASAKDIVIFHLSSWSFASLTSLKKCTFVTGVDAWSNLKLGHLKKTDLNHLQFLYFFIFFSFCVSKSFCCTWISWLYALGRPSPPSMYSSSLVSNAVADPGLRFLWDWVDSCLVGARQGLKSRWSNGKCLENSDAAFFDPTRVNIEFPNSGIRICLLFGWWWRKANIQKFVCDIGCSENELFVVALS